MVRCQDCERRLAACPRNEHGMPMAHLCYDVGFGRADLSSDHAIYWCRTGRIALCVAPRKVTHDGVAPRRVTHDE